MRRLTWLVQIMVLSWGSVSLLSNLSHAAEPADEYPFGHERRQERAAMVETLKRYHGRGITVSEQAVISAMLRVPRHRFIPSNMQGHAYKDSPVPIGHGQTISQPYIVALMTQLADIRSGMKVLEVGTGSGYQAAILAELTDQVYTMEIISPLAERTRLQFLDWGLKKIQTKEGDGYFGWPEGIQFDRILVTAAAAHIPPPLLRQLKPGGRMVIPVGPRWGNQELMLVIKDKQGKSRTRSLLPVRFVPLTGGGNEWAFLTVP